MNPFAQVLVELPNTKSCEEKEFLRILELFKQTGVVTQCSFYEKDQMIVVSFSNEIDAQYSILNCERFEDLKVTSLKEKRFNYPPKFKFINKTKIFSSGILNSSDFCITRSDIGKSFEEYCNSSSNLKENEQELIKSKIEEEIEDQKEYPCFKVFIYGLDYALDSKIVVSFFSKFGKIEDYHLFCNVNGTSKGLMTLTYNSMSSSKLAVEEMNEKEFFGRKIRVKYDKKASDRKRGMVNYLNDNSHFSCTVFASGLNYHLDEKDIIKKFSEFGKVVNCFLFKNKGKSKGMCRITYESVKNAKDAIHNLHGMYYKNRKIFVQFDKYTDSKANQNTVVPENDQNDQLETDVIWPEFNQNYTNSFPRIFEGFGFTNLFQHVPEYN